MIRAPYLYADFELSRMNVKYESKNSLKEIRTALATDYWTSLPQNEKKDFEQLTKDLNKLHPRVLYINRRLSYFTESSKRTQREEANLRKLLFQEWRQLLDTDKAPFISLSKQERKKICSWYKQK